MLGSRDYHKLLSTEIEKLSQNLAPLYDRLDSNRIHAAETIGCTRYSYYDRTEPLTSEVSSTLLSVLKRAGSNFLKSPSIEYKVDDLILIVTADMIIDDMIVNYVLVNSLPETADPKDLLYTNACLFGFDKNNGIILYTTVDGRHIEFFVPRSNKMFEQVVRRARILSILLKQKNTPVIEPSDFCKTCKYNKRCFIQIGKGTSSLEEIFGLGKAGQ
jgi:CRISPR-associated exonuclease Cas4